EIGEKELVADPEEILGLLLGERHARADAGMDEEVVALGMRQSEVAQEIEMSRRQSLAQLLLGAQEIAVGIGRADAVAPQRRVAAIGPPGGTDSGVGQEMDEAVLVIAEKMNALEAGQRLVDEA